MKRKGFAFFGLCAAFSFLLGTGIRLDREAAAQTAADPQTVVLIDAGHGGFDGGAVSPDGTLEKDINLAVATDLSVVLRLLGYSVEMTRESDVALDDDPTLSIRERKRADMAARLSRYDRATVTVSIHQNFFPQSSAKGAQVFCAPNGEESRALGTLVREKIISRVDPDNHRELKEGTRDVLLLYKTRRPAVLVECGFLSNPTERERLKTADYRRRLAFAIAEGVAAYQP